MIQERRGEKATIPVTGAGQVFSRRLHRWGTAGPRPTVGMDVRGSGAGGELDNPG